MKNKYKYLLWDIDGTVLDFLEAEKAAIKALFIKYGFGQCSDEMVQRYSEINARYWLALEKGEMSKDEILVRRFRDFFLQEGIDPDEAPSFNLDYQLALGDTIVFIDGAREMLEKEKGEYVLIAITNGTKRAQSKKLKVSGLDRVFDHVFISEDVGEEKPAIGFFEKVTEAARITERSKALVIGDSLTSDITGGIRAGFDTCWFNPKGISNGSGIIPDFEIRSLYELEDIL